jgi:Ni,Fe-hydrogenase III large subunit
MSSSVVTHRVALDAVPLLETKAWRDDVLRRHHEGSRMLTFFGKRAGERVVLTTVFREASGAVEVTRTATTLQFGYHELTSEWPALHCFEREVHEQTGLRIAAHPWLKPIRYEGRPQSAMDSYPFYQLTGKEVHEVAVGPIHAGVIEPGAFRFLCHGEQVHHLEIHLGYQHRGAEALLLRGEPTRLAPLVETLSGDTSVAHTWAYCAALESLSDCTLALETEVARAVVLELERVAMHLAGLSGLAADVGFLQGATTYGRLRTTAINTTMRLCGSRFGRGALRPGGVGMQLSRELLADVLGNLALLRRDLPIINDCFAESQTVHHRLLGAGVLSHAQALDLGLVGMAARASDVLIDARHEHPGGAYADLPLQTHVFPEGDCWARAHLRIAEMDTSLAWLEEILERHGSWERARKPIGALAPNELSLAMVEGWRGEVVHCLETDAAGRLAHYKVQDPSLRNWMGLAIAVRGNEISDFPICNKSFDLSYCGSDL